MPEFIPVYLLKDFLTRQKRYCASELHENKCNSYQLKYWKGYQEAIKNFKSKIDSLSSWENN